MMLAMGWFASAVIAIPTTIIFLFIVGCIMAICEAILRATCELIRAAIKATIESIRYHLRGLILHTENKPWTSDGLN